MFSTYVIIVNYNGWEDTIACLESVFKLAYPDVHVVVVDNGSKNQSADYLRAWAEGNLSPYPGAHRELMLPLASKPIDYNYLAAEALENSENNGAIPLTIIDSKKNGGFSYGNNLGIKYALRDKNLAYLWLLNNDTVVGPDVLTHYINRHHQLVQDKQKVGMLGATLLHFSNPKSIQCRGGYHYNPWFAYVTPVLKPAEVNKISYLAGASLFVPKEFVEDVGLLEEDYFLYFEELDWIKRGKKRGWSLAYAPQAVVYHKEGATIGGSSQLKKNRKKYIERLLFPKKPTVDHAQVLSLVHPRSLSHLSFNPGQPGQKKAARPGWNGDQDIDQSQISRRIQ